MGKRNQTPTPVFENFLMSFCIRGERGQCSGGKCIAKIRKWGGMMAKKGCCAIEILKAGE